MPQDVFFDKNTIKYLIFEKFIKHLEWSSKKVEFTSPLLEKRKFLSTCEITREFKL